MRVPLSWLKDFVEINLPVAEIDTILTNAGLEVKGTELIGLPGAALEWDPAKLVLGHILKVERHPDADKLVLATVAYGTDKPEVVVTGAPNLFPYLAQGDIAQLNLYSPLALEGAVLYDGHQKELKKMVLKGKNLRGVFNRCMLCSEKELGISEEHDGIILMQKDSASPDYRAGTPLVEVLGDAVFEIDIIPNIARCASMIGVARELAALTDNPLRYPSTELITGPDVGVAVEISTTHPELNPRFVAILIQGVSQKPSPYWMQYRLRLAGQRPLNVVVDISNYVMLEMGQPNHTFDYDFLRQRADQYNPGGPIRLITRLPEKGETLTTLDGKQHTLWENSILVTDPAGNLSVGGIMGGANSEIKPETQNVLLEAAAWNFINIRRSANRLGIHTEASFRFSRSVHPSQALVGAKRAARLLQQLAGGTIAPQIIDYHPRPSETVTVKLNPSYVRRLSGLDLSTAAIADLLRRLEFSVLPDGEYLQVTVPDHRMDIEGQHDLVEEVCRLVGYAQIPSTLPSDELPLQVGNPKLEKEERVKDILVQAGFYETITYRMTSPEKEALLLVNTPPDERPYVTITNPSSAERRVMRHSLLSSTLEVVANNSRYQERIAVFEIGSVYVPSEGGILPDELTRLAIVLTGHRVRTHWQENNPAMCDFYDLKGVIEELFNHLHLPVTFEAIQHPTYRPGRTARILHNERQVGVLGEIHPAVVEATDIRTEKGQAVLAAELDLEAILKRIPLHFAYEPLPTYPAMHEDLALVVDKSTTAVTLENAIRKAGGGLLKSVTLFDVYEGNNIPAGKKSLAYHLTFQSNNKTLTDKEVSKNRQRILQQLEQQLGAKLRE